MKKKYINIIGIFVLVATLFLTVGYSAFNDSLTIASSNAKVRIYDDINIRVTEVSATASGANVTDTDYTVKTINSTATLSQNGTITYTVTVKNLGNIPMAIYSIDESGLPSDLTILNTSGYDFTNKEKICDDNNSNNCSLNATKTFTITIGYDNYVSDSTVYNISLGFEFVPIYDVTYSNITVGNNYPTHAYQGKPFTVTFQNDIPYDIELSENFNYTYTNNTLTINSPTSDFTIYRYYSITYNLDGGTQAANQPTKYLHGNSVTLLDPTKTDYTFQGWYDNSGFTGNAITSTSGLSGNLTLYAKWESNSSGGGMGTPDNPYQDTTTNNYDPDDVPPNSVIIYNNVSGKPKVTSDNNGNITSFEYTDTGSNGFTIPSGGIETGIIAFDGNDFEVTLKANYTFSKFPSSGMAPIINLSAHTNNGISGILVGATMNSSGTAYNELGSSIQPRTNNKAIKFRINKYANGSISSGIDYYHKQNTAYYSYRLSTKTSTFTLTTKVHYSNLKVTSEIYYNDDYTTPLAKLKYSTSNQTTDTYMDFTDISDNITIQLGKWKDSSGQNQTLEFDVIEFSAIKT